MRLAWMIPAALIVASSSGEAFAQARAHATMGRDIASVPRNVNVRPERGPVERQVERIITTRLHARGEILGGSARSAVPGAQGTFKQAPVRSAAPAVAKRIQARADIESVRGRSPGSGGQQGGGSEQGGARTGTAGHFRVAESRLKNVVRCAEGSDSCGTVSREAVLPAPQATGGAARLMKAAEPFVALRERADKARQAIFGKTSRFALLCAIAATEACVK